MTHLKKQGKLAKLKDISGSTGVLRAAKCFLKRKYRLIIFSLVVLLNVLMICLVLWKDSFVKKMDYKCYARRAIKQRHNNRE